MGGRPSFGQLLDDDTGHGVPAGGGIAPWVVSTSADPNGHIHQASLDPIAKALHWTQNSECDISTVCHEL